MKHLVLSAFSNAIDDVFLTGVPFVAVAFVVAFFLEELPPRTGRETSASGSGEADEVPVLTE